MVNKSMVSCGIVSQSEALAVDLVHSVETAVVQVKSLILTHFKFSCVLLTATSEKILLLKLKV